MPPTKANSDLQTRVELPLALRITRRFGSKTPIRMGKGSLNRLLLSQTDLSSPTRATLYSTDPRAVHIRTVLSPGSAVCNLRIAVENAYLHDAAEATINPDASVTISLPLEQRRSTTPRPPVTLLVAMQRPKVIARILEVAASIGVSEICVVAAEKVEKTYWDCKLFREADDQLDASMQHSEDGINSASAALPGRPRGENNHPHRDKKDALSPPTRSVDHLPNVRRRLQTAVEQASIDAFLPTVVLEKRGIKALFDPAHPLSLVDKARSSRIRLVAHPYVGHGNPSDRSIASLISRAVSDCGGAVLAIGPEGGWTDAEISVMADFNFQTVSLGERVLRSETAVIIGLGLVHEGLRLQNSQDGCWPKIATGTTMQSS